MIQIPGKQLQSPMPASEAQLDERPTGNLRVAGSTPAGSAIFFREVWSWNIFYGNFLPSADSRMAVVSFWRNNVHNTGYPLRVLSLRLED